jgi:predicted Zn-dependent protease
MTKRPNELAEATRAAAAAGFLGLSTGQRDWLLLVAYLHLEQGKPETAVLLLRLLQRAFPEDHEVQHCVALAELTAGNPKEAARAATRAIKKTTPELRVPIGLVFAKALWEQNQPEAAREFLSNLLTESRN